MIWRAWYTEGCVYSSDETEWTQLPSTGLVWITVYRETGRTHYNGGDWYWIEGDEIRYLPSEGWDGWIPRPKGCLTCIKRGDRVSDEEFFRIQGEASEWR